jgi:hypothetical protein
MNRRSLLTFLGLAPVAAVVSSFAAVAHRRAPGSVTREVGWFNSDPAAPSHTLSVDELPSHVHSVSFAGSQQLRLRKIEVLRDMIDADERKLVDSTGRFFEPIDLDVLAHREVCLLEIANLERST